MCRSAAEHVIESLQFPAGMHIARREKYGTLVDEARKGYSQTICIYICIYICICIVQKSRLLSIFH